MSIGYQVSAVDVCGLLALHAIGGVAHGVLRTGGAGVVASAGGLSPAIAGSDDPGTMLAAAGVGWWTAALITLASVTTNFVNIYLSSLAWRTLAPRSTGAGSVWTIGLIGTALGLVSSGWLTRFAELMVLLGSILVPVGGVFLAHFVVLRKPIDIKRVYDAAALPAFNVAGIAAWAAGFIVYKLAAPIGARYRRSRPDGGGAALARARRGIVVYGINGGVTFVNLRNGYSQHESVAQGFAGGRPLTGSRRFGQGNRNRLPACRPTTRSGKLHRRTATAKAPSSSASCSPDASGRLRCR